jgi:hypothetical protein
LSVIIDTMNAYLEQAERVYDRRSSRKFTKISDMPRET